MATIGIDAALGRNTGTFLLPVWSVMLNVKDVTNPLSHSEADTTTRGSGGFRELIATLKEAEISWVMNYVKTDIDFQAIQTAWFARSLEEFFVANEKPIASGAEGFRAICQIFNFEITQPLEAAIEVNVSAKPVANSDGPPTWYVVP